MLDKLVLTRLVNQPNKQPQPAVRSGKAARPDPDLSCLLHGMMRF